MKSKKYLWIAITIITLIVIDQIIKYQVVQNLYNANITIIKGLIDLTYVENRGVAFGIGSSSRLVLIPANILIVILIAHFIITRKEELDLHVLIGLILVISGGIGNLVDRIFRGYVIDYIDINSLFKFAIFNFADTCVSIGVAIIAISILIYTIKQRKG